MLPKNSTKLKLLPQEEWKAFRIINFMVEQANVCFIYERKFDGLEQLEINDHVPSLPIDEIDKFLLSWIRIKDSEAQIYPYFFVFEHEIVDFYKQYDNQLKARMTLSAFPSCGNRTLQELTKFNGMLGGPMQLEYYIGVYDLIPHIMIGRNYDIGEAEKFDAIIAKIKNEVRQQTLL